MLNISQFRELIVKPALHGIMLNSEEAEELLVFTCAAESQGCTYLKQNFGTALGIYQMEPVTYNDIWMNYIRYQPSLNMMLSLNFACTSIPSEERLIYDMRFATVMARIHYHRISEHLPKSTDVEAIWEYYKKYYNTPNGKAFKQDAISNYFQFLKRSHQDNFL